MDAANSVLQSKKQWSLIESQQYAVGKEMWLAGMMESEINIAITPATWAEDVKLGTVSLCAIHPAVNNRKNKQKMNVGHDGMVVLQQKSSWVSNGYLSSDKGRFGNRQKKRYCR